MAPARVKTPVDTVDPLPNSHTPRAQRATRPYPRPLCHSALRPVTRGTCAQAGGVVADGTFAATRALIGLLCLDERTDAVCHYFARMAAEEGGAPLACMIDRRDVPLHQWCVHADPAYRDTFMRAGMTVLADCGVYYNPTAPREDARVLVIRNNGTLNGAVFSDKRRFHNVTRAFVALHVGFHGLPGLTPYIRPLDDFGRCLLMYWWVDFVVAWCVAERSTRKPSTLSSLCEWIPQAVFDVQRNDAEAHRVCAMSVVRVALWWAALAFQLEPSDARFNETTEEQHTPCPSCQSAEGKRRVALDSISAIAGQCMTRALRLSAFRVEFERCPSVKEAARKVHDNAQRIMVCPMCIQIDRDNARVRASETLLSGAHEWAVALA
jgi:hypothetical protein